MSLRLIIEHSSHPQDRREIRHPGGEFSIGRGAECSWQLNDPEMFVSRKHCVITGELGLYTVTDASRGGLFIDGKDQPLGPGNAARLEAGMRLRMGDTVIRVEIEAPEPVASQRTQASAPRQLDDDDFFSRPVTPPPPVPRPEGLPQPFAGGTIDVRRSDQRQDRPIPPPQFDDPFNLDRSVVGRPSGSVPAPITPRADDFSFDGFFDQPSTQKVTASAAERLLPSLDALSVVDDIWAMPLSVRQSDQVLPTAEPAPEVAVPAQPPSPASVALILDEEIHARQHVEAAPSPPSFPEEPAALDHGLREAFYRGLGLDPATAPHDPAAEMEAIGQRFRLLAEGLMLMLRTRAKEKQNARVAQTVISNTDVNPLKFLASTNEVIAALVAPRGPGYLAPDDAINGAFRDLADHQLRSWVAIQSALRRMIDRFDPTAIEKDLVELGMIESLLAGGRNAKLWKAYTDRYKDIARAAEDRFLGDVGADFRDAYESNREKRDDT